MSERRADNQSKPKSRAGGSPPNARTLPRGNLMGTSRPPPRQPGEQRGQGSTRSRRGGMGISGGFWWPWRLPWCQFIDAEDVFSEGKQLPRGSRGSRQQVEGEGLLVSWLPGAGPFPATTPAAADPAKPIKNQHLGQQTTTTTKMLLLIHTNACNYN